MSTPRPIIVLNAGSHSLKLDILQAKEHGFAGLQAHSLAWPDGAPGSASCAEAVGAWWDTLELTQLNPLFIAHRFVHDGGLGRACRLDPATRQVLADHAARAPLHQQIALAVYDAVLARAPQARQMAVFDTGLYAQLPEVARHYALPDELSERHALHRVGYHGLAHGSLLEQYRAAGGQGRRVITLQLGGGCSATAFDQDRPIDTSMGFSPGDGLMMATRCGSIDPAIILHLLREGWSLEQVDALINGRSGLLGVSGMSADMRVLLAAEAQGHAGASRAITLFCERLIQQIGAFSAALEGLDALVFGGGIGFGSAEIRARVLTRLAWLGAALDEGRNWSPDNTGQISAADTLDVRVFETQEAPVIAAQAMGLIPACCRPGGVHGCATGTAG